MDQSSGPWVIFTLVFAFLSSFAHSIGRVLLAWLEACKKIYIRTIQSMSDHAREPISCQFMPSLTNEMLDFRSYHDNEPTLPVIEPDVNSNPSRGSSTSRSPDYLGSNVAASPSSTTSIDPENPAMPPLPPPQHQPPFDPGDQGQSLVVQAGSIFSPDSIDEDQSEGSTI